jgi:uncharacterized secreted protein with C-terminal beta-propeller domain
MRTRSRLALSGGFVSAAVVGGLFVGGLAATTATLVLTDPLAPRASADSLSRFDSCAALRNWYVEHGTAEVGPYGWNGPVMYAMDDAVPMPSGAGLAASSAGQGPEAAIKGSDARSSSGTGTNTQEADVDEPDLVKTDGRRVVRLVDQRVLVVTDVTGPEPRELGRISLPIDVYGGELLLAGDHVLVSQAAGAWGRPMPMEGDLVAPDLAVPQEGVQRTMIPAGGTRIVDVDISDPAHPRIAHDDTYSGRQVSMRLYGDTVRLVTTTGRPELPWARPRNDRPGTSWERNATRHNEALVRATTIDDWLPTVVDNMVAGSRPAPLVSCTDVYHPQDWSGSDTTAVTTYDVGDPAHRTAVAVTGDGQVVYSSADRLYVASTRVDPPSPWRRMPGPMNGSMTGGAMPIRAQDVRTQLHAFALEGTTTQYVGSGHVDGSVRDRWSLDEHGGLLRVAWTKDGSRTITDANGETRQATRNGITVLAEKDGSLVPTGTVDDLGIDENIQSVRWFDDFAVLVTFRQMDPLYTIDLTDPTHPREIGQLKIPGYSGYLHPLGDGLLLGLGVDATDLGRSLGAQSAVFDIHDLAAPQRLAHLGFGEQSYLPALDDPRAFTWLPDQRTALTTVEGGSSGLLRLVALHVGAGGALDARDLVTDADWSARTLPLADGRVALVDDQHGVRLLTLG